MNGFFDRWERVWHEGQYNLIPACIAQAYIRHVEFMVSRSGGTPVVKFR